MTKVPHILKIDTIEELKKYIAYIPSNISSSDVSESYLDISDDLLQLIPWETKEILWNSHVYFRALIPDIHSDVYYFKSVISTLKYESLFVKGMSEEDFKLCIFKLNSEQLSSLFSEGLVTIVDIIKLLESKSYGSLLDLRILFYKLSGEQIFKLARGEFLSRLVREGVVDIKDIIKFSGKLSGEQIFGLFNDELMLIKDIIKLVGPNDGMLFLRALFDKLSSEQTFKLVSDGFLSRLVREGITSIEDIVDLCTNTNVSSDNLVNFILQNGGWDIATQGLPVRMSGINLDTIKLALKKGLKPEYVIENNGVLRDLTTRLKFVSAAIDNGYKLDDLDWNKLKEQYSSKIDDTKDISMNLLLAAIKNSLVSLEYTLTYTIFESLEQKIDFISNISAMGNDLNDMNSKMFTLGFSTDQIKTFLERGLRLEKLTPVLPELFSASNSKAELLRCLVRFGLELKIFEDNNGPAIIPHLDIESLQFLLDNGMTAVGIVWTIFHSSVDQEVLNEHLQFLIDNQSATEGLKIIFRIGETTDTAITKARLTKKALIDKLIEGTLDRGADINSVINDKDFISFPIEFLFLHKDLLFLHPENSLSGDNILEVVLRANIRTNTSTFERYEYDLEKVNIQRGLLSIALDKDVDLKGLSTGHFVDRHISLEALSLHKELWFSHPTNSLSADSVLKLALGAGYTLRFNETTKQDEYDEKEIMHQGELIVAALYRNADVNGIMNDENAVFSSKCFFEHIDLLRYHPTNPLSAENTLRIILQMRMDTYNRITEKSEYDLEKCKVRDELIKYAIDQEVDFNTKISSAEFSVTLFEKLFGSNNFEMVDFVLNSKSYTVGAAGWVRAIENNYGTGFLTNALKRFPNGFSKDEAKHIMRAQGTSHALISSIIDIYDLAKDIVESMVAGESSILSDIELRIFNTTEEISLADCANGKYKNRFGFSQLSLALFAKRFELAIEMINAGASLIETNNNGVTPIQIFKKLSDADQVPQDHEKTLEEVIFAKLENLDVILNKEGESLIDSYLGDERFKDEALARTNDPLFTFYKPNASLFSLDPKQTHIAITFGEGFWSTGINALSRLVTIKHPKVVFHLVSLATMDAGGNRFIKQFSGWINPGAGDSFPSSKVEFNKNDWQQSMEIEQAYQKALNWTSLEKIPYTGMCAGAQNLALYHGAYLQPLQGYSHGQHSVTYIKGTIAHFMAMNKEQQKQALQDCEFPEIRFKGDTAHHYAAIPHKLGDWLQLGAISEDGVTMSYCHKNGLACATQFHPEHYYHIEEEGNHQKIWLENFIGLAKMHHEHMQLGSLHPKDIFKSIVDRLNECIKAPSCLVEHNSSITGTVVDCYSMIYGTEL